MRQKNKSHYIIFSVIIVTIIIAYLALNKTGAIAFIQNGEALKQWFLQLGMAGPFIIIALMILAITMSPIPSAPIALAAGAVYGHIEGAIYVLIGSELGAIIAFFIARLLGVDIVKKWFGGGLTTGLLGSQNTLMGIVFISRLLPFISFDMVSYAAGLTSLSFLRFTIATLLGIIPASFLLAHFGSELASDEATRIALTLVALGILTLIPIVIKTHLNKRNKSRSANVANDE